MMVPNKWQVFLKGGSNFHSPRTNTSSSYHSAPNSPNAINELNSTNIPTNTGIVNLANPTAGTDNNALGHTIDNDPDVIDDTHLSRYSNDTAPEDLSDNLKI